MNCHLVDIAIEITSKNDSLRASSPSGGYREKKPRSRVLARLTSLAQIEELACRLKTKATLACTFPSKLTLASCTCFDYPLPLIRENHLRFGLRQKPLEATKKIPTYDETKDL